MKFLRIGLILFILFFAFLESKAASDNIVRVAVVTDAGQIKLSIRSPYKILALNTNQELDSGRRLWKATVLPTESGLKIGDQEFPVFGLRIQPENSPAIYLNNRKFRGAIDLIRETNQTLLAINHLDVEEYIAGVLYHEVAAWWSMEALKAQAIVARSFALYQTQVNVKKDYDLVSTVYSQVYGGRTSERGRTSKAVRLTQGQVLTYKNRIFPTFYHATCAGHTEQAANLWKINLPPLRGRPCQFCERSPHFKWSKKVSLKSISKFLQREDFQVGEITSIKIIDRSVSGRITDLEIVSSQGKIGLSANHFRLAVGPNLLRSTNFELEINKDKAYFQGYGWGHGVGMCQWGALFMAREGFNAEQILDYYYPESKVKTLDEIKDAQGRFKTF